MRSTIFLSLFSLPATFAFAIHARQQNGTAVAPPSTTPLPILPPPDFNTQALVAPNCARWDKIGADGLYRCSNAVERHRDVTYSELVLWNPSVGPSCDNIWNGYWLCTAISGPFIPQPSHAPAGVAIRPPVNPIASMPAYPTCDRWDLIPWGASCGTYMSLYPGLTLTDLQTWNPFIIKDEYRQCTLSAPYYLCTSVVGHVFPVTTPPTDPGVPSGVRPPGPTQAGVSLVCMAWDMVEYGQSCQTFMDKYDLTMEELVSWNPAVGSECTTLWGGYAVCIGV